ncbi:MAG: TatD family hydrolase [Xanthomonadaceae bacterium]|nr:TatD family hydrolase [Xanthomonadaceae bacterium]
MAEPTLIDSHCHLNYEYTPKSTDDLVREATESGVSHMVTIGTEIATLQATSEIAEKYANVYFTAGVHPHESETMKDEDIAVLEKFARHKKCRAIGEIGLDYYYKHSAREPQIKRLRDQLDLALKVGQPIVVHSREAEEDLLPELTMYAKSFPQGEKNKDGTPRPIGAIHCFTGTRAFGEACMNLGFLISFSGILTFKSATDLQECARAFPLEKLMVETDSPYLAPIPMRGKKCEPAMVRYTAVKLAELKGVTLDEVARVTSANAKAMFRI